MIRVLLVDDHALLRAGTRAALDAAADLTLVAECARGEEALALARQVQPDVVLLDIQLPDMSGVEVARLLLHEAPRSKVLVLTGYHYEQYVRMFFALGGHGYLLKTAMPDELRAGIRAVQRGEQVLSAEVAAQMAAARTHRAGIAAVETLSERERDVLGLVEYSNREIAQRLSIGERTVATHVSNAMAKLGARSRTEALTLAIQRGIIAPKHAPPT